MATKRNASRRFGGRQVLGAFSRDLTVYLALHPERATELKSMFGDAGLSIPIGRLLALSSYNRFRYFLGRRRARSGLLHAAGLVFARNEDSLERAIRIRNAYEISLRNLIDESPSIGTDLRRWQVQSIRRVINSLFYLRSFRSMRHSTEKEFVCFVSPELVEQRALAQALSSGDVGTVLPFYGRAPAAPSRGFGENMVAIRLLLAEISRTAHFIPQKSNR